LIGADQLAQAALAQEGRVHDGLVRELVVIERPARALGPR
jgi:hypothetical protein